MDLAKIYFYLIQTKSHYLSEKTTINNITEKGKYEQENCLDKDCNSIFNPVLMKSDDSVFSFWQYKQVSLFKNIQAKS